MNIQTIRKVRRKKQTIILLALLLILFVSIILSFKTKANPTSSITVSPNVYFRCSSYDTEINFATTKTFDTLTFENGYWYFNRYGFCLEDANITISQFFTGDILAFTVNGTGLSTTKIYLAEKPKPLTVKIDGVSTPIDYNAATKILTVNVVHSSPAEVSIDFSAWPTSVLAVWNIVPIIFLISVSMYFVKEKKKPSLYEIVGVSVAFLILAILVPVILNLGWYG